MNYFMECCTYFKDILPRAELRFIPALLIGVLLSSLLIIELYKKKSQKSLFEAVKDIFYMMLFSYPDNGHFEFRKCLTKGCLKCRDEEELRYRIGKKYDSLDTKSISSRVQNAVSLMSSNYEPIESCHPNIQKPTVFTMKLVSNSWWGEYDIYHREKELLKLNFDIIVSEFKEIYRLFELGKTEGWKLNLTPTGHWCVFPILSKGIFNEENARKCLNTSELLKNLSPLMSGCVFGNAYYSLLYPDSVISSHHGPSNIRLRCNLALDVPQKNCYLKIAGEKHSWKVGDFTIYDDSFEHSFYSAPRKELHKPLAVLVVDFWHPDISQKEMLDLRTILADV